MEIEASPEPFATKMDPRLPLGAAVCRDAFERSLDEIRLSIPSQVQNEIIEIIRFLCEPDPKRRGHPADLDGSQFNLERVISAFDLMATKAEYGLLE